MQKAADRLRSRMPDTHLSKHSQLAIYSGSFAQFVVDSAQDRISERPHPDSSQGPSSRAPRSSLLHTPGRTRVGATCHLNQRPTHRPNNRSHCCNRWRHRRTGTHSCRECSPPTNEWSSPTVG
ncbi:hypothetical protein AMAG_20606 [Allomyces macrogynus ATCC 38327]|uniref:Uncharacterized protein n=1 Tax=Allomyces macrogynus (strain ATCC 38327) TaxID=578462 RepID=A0A0L0TCZ9_ALLM3|nr:hypothetical protein AMAG_20606 [Allomyces macrogynus ATCC 38327]|eukprot:KNE72556.1 hypothetical protein AMAG_20606 [Allomyces macrogynus ATCC 38327]